MIRVAILTDLPFLYDRTMYLDLLEKTMPAANIISDIHIIESSKLFKRIDNLTGITRIFHTFNLLPKLSHYDIIHAQLTHPIGFTFALLSVLGLCRKPLIVHTHGYDVFSVPQISYGFRRNKIGKILTSFTWKRADTLIAVCKKAKEEIEKSGIGEKKIATLYNGVDHDLFRKNIEVPKEISRYREKTDFLILSVASLVPVKNHERMLRVFRQLVKKYASKYRMKLLLIGQNHCSDLTLDRDIIYVGKIDHDLLKYYYNIADVFLLPSMSEAHPWSLLEAMSCELPVIASAVGGIPETLQDDRLLVNPFDDNDIMNKIELVIKIDKKEREAIGRKNREIIIRQFSFEKHRRDLAAIYKGTLQK